MIPGGGTGVGGNRDKMSVVRWLFLFTLEHFLFFFLSFVPGPSAGSFSSLSASEISHRKQNATLYSKARGGHLRAGNVYDRCPSTFCRGLFLNYTCACTNCGWRSRTNSETNEPHSELGSLWRQPCLSQCACRVEMRRLRPYHPAHTRSHRISEAKQGRARLVLGWE